MASISATGASKEDVEELLEESREQMLKWRLASLILGFISAVLAVSNLYLAMGW
jgi:hypothetical protein